MEGAMAKTLHTRTRPVTRSTGIGTVLILCGILIALFWTVTLGVIVSLVGLITFAGFVRGQRY
jgi:hypothetical protein